MTRLAEGVYVRLSNPNGNAVSNAGIVVLERSVLVFDTHFTPEAGQSLLAKIQAITTKPIRYVVNSHFHSDHTHGNQAFSRVQQIIGSTNTRRDILQKDLPTMNRMISVAQTQVERLRKDLLNAAESAQKESVRKQIAARLEFVDRMSREKIVPPDVTFDETLSLQESAHEIRLMYLGNGHTEGDVILFLPAERIVFLGDLFFNACLPNAQDANLLDWMKTLGVVLKLDADKFVPGHGPVGDKKDVRIFLSYLEDLRALVEPAVARGDTLEQAVQEIQLPAKYSSNAFPNFFPANVQKMYAQLKAAHQAASEAVEVPEKLAPGKPRP